MIIRMRLGLVSWIIIIYFTINFYCNVCYFSSLIAAALKFSYRIVISPLKKNCILSLRFLNVMDEVADHRWSRSQFDYTILLFRWADKERNDNATKLKLSVIVIMTMIKAACFNYMYWGISCTKHKYFWKYLYLVFSKFYTDNRKDTISQMIYMMGKQSKVCQCILVIHI